MVTFSSLIMIILIFVAFDFRYDSVMAAWASTLITQKYSQK